MNYTALHELLSPGLLVLSEHFPLEERYRKALSDYTLLVHPLFESAYVDHATASLINVEAEGKRVLELFDRYLDKLPEDEDLLTMRLFALFQFSHEDARVEAERLFSIITTESARETLNEYAQTVNDFANKLGEEH